MRIGDGAAANAATVKIAVSCKPILNSELPDERYNIVVLADGEGFTERLRVMRELTKHEIAVHGGMGTLEEIFGGIKVRERLQLLVPFWAPLTRTLGTMYNYGYIKPKDMRCIAPVNAQAEEGESLGHTTPVGNFGFREDAERVTGMAKMLLAMRKKSGAVLGGHAEIKDVIEQNDSFILPPGGIDAMLQATQIICWKRMDIYDSRNARYPGLDKPLVIFNIDGCYDDFIQQWHDIEAGGFLAPGETVDRLMKVVNLSSHATPAETRAALASAVPLEKSPREVISRC